MGKQFLPGQSGNPGGRPALPPEIRAERKKNQGALILLIAEFFSLTPAQAKKRLKKGPDGKQANQLARAVQGLIGRSIRGDVKAFRYLMEVMIGKLPETDWDGYTEDDLRILARVKEVYEEERRRSAVGQSH